MTKTKLSTKWARIVVLLAAMAGLSALSFNCAPRMFQSVDFSSNGGSGFLDDIFGGKNTSPFALMTAKQTYETFLNVTGQSGKASAAQLTEYTARAAALANSDKLSGVNASLMMAATSLAGEVCNGLVTTEAAATADARRFFRQVDFTKAVSGNTPAAFDAAIDVMAGSFWGRGLTAEERETLRSFYSDFVAGAGTQAAGTRNLYLATCSGMLAAFDTYNL